MIALILSAALAAGGAPQGECLILPATPGAAEEAANQSWYVNGEPLKFFGTTYVKEGKLNTYKPGELKRFAGWGKVILAKRTDKPAEPAIYVLTNYSRCEFHRYPAK